MVIKNGSAMSKKDIFYDELLPKLRQKIIEEIMALGIDKFLDRDVLELSYKCTDGLFNYAEHILEDEE